jgi:glycosyltransferase involved in cell wall biosynthesis
MKVIIPVHHFLPHYASGVELYTYRLARWLLRHGHTVGVVCVESIAEGGREPHCVEDVYENIPVYRLHFNLDAVLDPFRWQFWNPEIGSWFKQFLDRMQPDIVHINSLYLLSASIVMAVEELGLPTVLTLHDYWFQCPRITLLKPDGSVCDVPDDPVECAWCLMTERRRYRLPEIASRRAAGRLGRWALRRPRVASLLGWQEMLHAIRERRRLLRGVLDQGDVFTVATHFLGDMLVKQGCPQSKVMISRYGLDISSWEPVAAPAEDARHLRIAYIGQVTHHKGIHILIQAFNRLKASAQVPELKIYGNLKRFPRYAAQLRKLAAGNPGITFAGTYDNKNTPQVFAGIDALVVPSTWYEGSPLVIEEALATRTPVIASNLGGMAEGIHHGVNGLVFEPSNVEDLTRQLQRLLDDPNLLPQMHKGIQSVRTIDDEMAQLIEIYRSLVSEDTN